MVKKIINPVVIFQLAVALPLIVAGIGKALDPQAFYEHLLQYQLGNSQLLLMAAYLVPWIEILAAICLFIKALRRGAYVFSFLLFFSFQIFLIQAKVRGLDLHCACFGNGMETSLGISIIRNSVLICFLLLSLFYIRQQKTKEINHI